MTLFYLLRCLGCEGWGSNQYGQLGVGDTTDRESVWIDSNGNTVTDEANLDFVDLGWNVTTGTGGTLWCFSLFLLHTPFITSFRRIC